jgi:hypothetical protein
VVSEYLSVWHGRDPLTVGLERDYDAMRLDHWIGWDPIYLPPSPLTTNWSQFFLFALPDPTDYYGPRRRFRLP